MPCNDGPSEARETSEYRAIKAMLCVALTLIEKRSLFGELNYTDSGIGQYELTKWWREHKEVDAERRREEEESAEEDLRCAEENVKEAKQYLAQLKAKRRQK